MRSRGQGLALSREARVRSLGWDAPAWGRTKFPFVLSASVWFWRGMEHVNNEHLPRGLGTAPHAF